MIFNLQYPNNKIVLEYVYNENEFPSKHTYSENGTINTIDFEYTFDDRKNWIEQTKSVNGKKLYVWKRDLKYFE